MCFNISLVTGDQDMSRRYDFLFDRQGTVEPIYHSSAFSFPDHPLICSDDPEKMVMGRWGLIPEWAQSPKQRAGIRAKTLNARSETVFQLPSFRHAVRKNRCLIPVTGFFEFREVNGRKFPHHIRMEDGRVFSLGGIFEDVADEGKRTFSIVTTEANRLMARIHNTRKRMPLILDGESERIWIDPEAAEERIKGIMIPYPNDDLTAYPVSRDLARKDMDTNEPFILEEVEYPELNLASLDDYL